jgi:hypothetical protein
MKSQSLTIFLLLLIVFLCFTECYQGEKYYSFKPKGKKGKPQKPALKISLPSKNSNQAVGDYQVCSMGKHIGLITPDASCVVQFPNLCQESIVRKADLPPVSRAKRATIARQTLRNSKVGSKAAVKNIKKKFRWTLAGRAARHRKPKLTLRQKKAKIIAKKKQLKRQANLRQARSIARKILQRRSESRSKGKKGLRKEAKRLAKKVTFGTTRPVRIALGLKRKPVPRRFARTLEKKRVQVQRDFSKGNFCVKSVTWNLSHCCHFENRNEAQHFANNLPVPRVYQKRLREGKRAIYLDNMRAANKQVIASTKDLKKVKKIVHKRKEKIKKGGKKK